MAAKRKTARRRRSYGAAPRRRSGGKKTIHIAPVVGAIGSALTGYSQYKTMREAGRSVGNSLAISFAGWDTNSGGSNDIMTNVIPRLANTYAPVIGGVAVHEVVGNTKGAMGTGFGLKLNKYLPKGINL